VETDAVEQLVIIPKTEFESCFQHWQKCWNICVCSEGAYFEGGLNSYLCKYSILVFIGTVFILFDLSSCIY